MRNSKHATTHPQSIAPLRDKMVPEFELPPELEFDQSHQDVAIITTENKIKQRPDLNAECASLFEIDVIKEIESFQNATVHGVFLERYGEMLFAPTKEGRFKTAFTCSSYLPGVYAIADFFTHFDVIAILRGHTEGHVFYVSEIHSGGIIRNSGLPFSKVSDAAIQAICNRIRYDLKQLSDDKIHLKNDILCQETEVKLLYSALMKSFSPDQCDWIDHNIARMTTPNVSRDERNQALRALSYVLNINWRPRKIKLAEYYQIKTELDNRFFGLDKVKMRILEVVAQIRRCGRLPQWGILLNGPAGVGKTTIAVEVAKAMNMRLITIDLSSMNDSESLVGSSRIYSNAKPGIIAEKLLENRDSNCVMLLNELDKASAGKDRGNPADTLLTLVDKLGFIDNYLETAIDTSNIFFIATCNDVNRISRPLRDRFFKIDIEGYSAHEKQVIFSDYILPKVLSTSNVSDSEIQVTAGFTEHLCKYYSNEPGVRELEQFAERIVGDFLLRSERDNIASRTYEVEDIVSLFGKREVNRRNIATAPGQAKTIVCYDNHSFHVLIQATCKRGSGKLDIYGVIGDYQRDCCKVAYECAKGLSNIDFEKLDVSLYISRNIPAFTYNFLGCATFAAIMSAITKRLIPSDIAYLGGCDLLGNVFWDESNLNSIISCAESAGESALYGPIGLAELAGETYGISIIESYNAALLFEVSSAQEPEL